MNRELIAVSKNDLEFATGVLRVHWQVSLDNNDYHSVDLYSDVLYTLALSKMFDPNYYEVPMTAEQLYVAWCSLDDYCRFLEERGDTADLAYCRSVMAVFDVVI